MKDLRGLTMWCAAGVLALACGEDLGPEGPGGPGSGNGNGNGDAEEAVLETRDMADGVLATQVKATDYEAWVYVDLDVDRAAVVDISNGGESTDWDLAFRRSNIKVNGGHSGPADVAVAAVPRADFDAMTQAPVALFEADAPAAAEENQDQPDFIDDDGTDFVFGRPNAVSPNGWFDYDPINHVLSPADVVFVIRSSEGNFFKFGFLGYYSEAGSSGYPTFRWAPVDAPIGVRAVTVNASSREDFVFLNLETLEELDVADPGTSTAWDVALRRTLVRTNGGASGPGFGGGLELADASFDAVDWVDTVGFVVDGMVSVPGPGMQTEAANDVLSSWFDYNPMTRQVSPRDTVFVVRDAEGQKHKVRVDGWNDGTFDLRVEPVPPKPDIRTVEVTAGDETWTYFSLRLGEVLDGEMAEQSPDWDLAFRGTDVRTHGGAVAPSEVVSLDELVVVPEDEGAYQPDQGDRNPLLSGPEGSGPVVLELGDGSFAKAVLTPGEGGVWQVEFAYAGPGRRSFR